MKRLITRHTSYVALAAGALTLSVGSTLTVFSVVNALWLRPLPLPNPDRLVMLVSNQGGGPGNNSAFFGVESYATATWSIFDDVAGQVVSSGQLAGLRPRVMLAAVGHEVETVGVTSRYFGLLGLPIRGRDFTRDDNRAGAEPVAIISDRLWATGFASRPDVIGAVVDATPFPIRIVGVAPAAFSGVRRGDLTEMWIPAALVHRVAPAGDLPAGEVPTLILGRLRPGLTPVEADRRLGRDAANPIERAIKDRVQVVPLHRVFGTPTARTIAIEEERTALVVAAGAGLVLLAGSATLMALVIVHYERRRHELSVRLALGSSRGRLMAGMIGELGWLAAAGLIGALLLARLGVGTLRSLSLPGGVDLGRLDLSMDWRVICAAAALTAATLVTAAIVPVMRFTRARFAREVITSTATSPPSSQRLRQLLLGFHVAATIVVLVGAGLFVRAVLHAFNSAAGFAVDRTVFVQVQLVPPFLSNETDLAARNAAIESRRRDIAEALGTLPFTEVVARGGAPIGPDQASRLLSPLTIQTGDDVHNVRAGVLAGDAQLPDALGVRLLQGRRLTTADTSVRPQPVLVTASLARALWPRDTAVGQNLTISPKSRAVTSTVVGVLSDVAFGSVTVPSAGVVFSMAPVASGANVEFVVRAERAEVLAGQIRELLRRTVPDAPKISVATGREVLATDVGRQRLGAWFFCGFGLSALVLGAGGVFGLVAYLAETRRREFGVLMALGATHPDLVRRGMVAGLGPVSLGAIVGLIAAGLVSRLFVAILPGLSLLDPLSYLAATLLMVGASAVASIAAAWRLRHLSPANVLRAQ